LLKAIAASGARVVVFAGGDPTLRRDLPELVEIAKQLGLGVEVQTNAHFMPAAIRGVLLGPTVGLLGLSVDGATAATHDAIRVTRGNYKKVLGFLKELEGLDKPTIVRTVVSQRNFAELSDIGKLVSKFTNVVSWSLLEFTPIGEGYLNSKKFAVSPERYRESCARVVDEFGDRITIDQYVAEDKVGTYALVTPDGYLYGTASSKDGVYPLVGNFLSEHVADLASALNVNAENHQHRYGEAFSRVLRQDP